MFSRILAPLDGSATAEQIFPYLHLIVKGLQLPVELVRVVEHLPPEWMDWVIGREPLLIAAALGQHAQEYLAGVEKSLAEAGLKVQSQICSGDADSAIVSLAAADPDALLAMCTHGRSGMARWLLGSVTEKVLHSTTNPLFIVRAREEASSTADVALETVIVPLDGSRLAEQVIPYVITFAEAFQLEVLLVRVTLPTEDRYRSLGYPLAPYADLANDMDELAADYFRQLKRKLLQQGVANVEDKLLHGNPADAIVELAQETPQSLIAMTSHGRSGIGLWALGSVAHKVVTHADNPVLLVRARDDPFQET
ncbi:MAG: universal stress protein [Dehalococcoidia bacterium]